MDKYYSELINENLYYEINKIKTKIGFIEDTYTRKILGYTFVFVNSKECKCVCVEESKLEITKIENHEVTKVVVLLNTETKYAGYWNHNYVFIGIFDTTGRKSPIKLGQINLNSIKICSDFRCSHYDSDLIYDFNVTIFCNPFSDYVRKVIKPVRKAIASSFPANKWTFEPFDLEKEEFEIDISIAWRAGFLETYYIIPSYFDSFLYDLKSFSDYFENNLIGHIGESKFKAENYTK